MMHWLEGISKNRKRAVRLSLSMSLEAQKPTNWFRQAQPDMVFRDAVDSLIKDKKTQSAIDRKLEAIGEVSNRISKEYNDAGPTIEWNKIIRARHSLMREYKEAKLEIGWRITTLSLPKVKKRPSLSATCK
jgi:uncharacterized protein with HEPN domain